MDSLKKRLPLDKGSAIKGRVVRSHPAPNYTQPEISNRLPQNNMIGRTNSVPLPTLPIPSTPSLTPLQNDSSTAHTARPLSSLQDPSSFGPPPVRRTTADPPPPPPSRSGTNTAAPPPSLPSRNSPRPSPTTTFAPPPAYTSNPPGGGGPPALPPRLPPRNAVATPPPPSQGAISRLGAAGISVPGLGIGKSSSSTTPTALDNLHSSFSRMRPPSVPPAVPEQGTTTEQKRAALSTAAAFRQNPGSVSAGDARSALATANNFRQRHGAEVTAGARVAGGLNEKYGERVGQMVGGREGVAAGGQQDGTGGLGGLSAAAKMVAGKKKPPPPPPSRKPAGLARQEEQPPPVPFSTRPF